MSFFMRSSSDASAPASHQRRMALGVATRDLVVTCRAPAGGAEPAGARDREDPLMQDDG
jgi:hypothetical protein